jgi:hypothetical protein
MKIYAKTSLTEFLEDRVVYRNIEPADERLPGLKSLNISRDLETVHIPRKTEPEYARAVIQILKEAQAQRSVSQEINRLIYLGDTRLLDGSAFSNLCVSAGWPGIAFIGAENNQAEKIEILAQAPGQTLYLANRWSALCSFADYAVLHGFPVAESTVVVIDIDKTALGGRGRNSQVIDQARLLAVQDTVAGLLGESYDPAAFKIAYDTLNQPEFHTFTTDNQDYLAYICLILGSSLYQLNPLIKEILSGQLVSFEQFISEVNRHRRSLSPELTEIHAEIFAYVQAGDPTPFKLFRRNEYLRTISCFGSLPDAAPVEEMIQEEILITEEVRQAALAWKRQGALLFGLSDKPDEAATPTPELAAIGYQPIHRALTHSVGAGIPKLL